MIRYFRQVSSGQWFADTFGGSAVSTVDAATHRRNVAERYGLADVDVKSVDANTDPRTGALLPTPLLPPLPVDPDEELRRAIESATDLNTLKSALLGRSGLAAVRGRFVGP